jgi:hypothetical protein
MILMELVCDLIHKAKVVSENSLCSRLKNQRLNADKIFSSFDLRNLRHTHTPNKKGNGSCMRMGRSHSYFEHRNKKDYMGFSNPLQVTSLLGGRKHNFHKFQAITHVILQTAL